MNAVVRVGRVGRVAIVSVEVSLGVSLKGMYAGHGGKRGVVIISIIKGCPAVLNGALNVVKKGVYTIGGFTC
jgi:hypothetical protein